jgi:hypothetical protein
MTHAIPLLHDPVVRSVLHAIETGQVPCNLVDLLAPDGRIHPETASLLHRLLDLPEPFTRDVLTLGSMLPHHPARGTVVERVVLALHTTDNPTEQGYLLACLARIDAQPVLASRMEDLADQIGGVDEPVVRCRTCHTDVPLAVERASHPLVEVAHATGCLWWADAIGHLVVTTCACVPATAA